MVSFKLFEGDRQIDIYIYRYEHTHCEGGGVECLNIFFYKSKEKMGIYVRDGGDIGL